jgi:hypothetical protein
MQLKHKPATFHQPLVLGAAVGALTAKQPLVPATAGFDIMHTNERLRMHIEGGLKDLILRWSWLVCPSKILVISMPSIHKSTNPIQTLGWRSSCLTAGGGKL